MRTPVPEDTVSPRSGTVDVRAVSGPKHPEACEQPRPPDLERDDVRRLRAPERALVVLETFLAVSGTGGGIALASRPLTAMPLRYLHGTWFHTWRWPGLALLFFVGVCPALVAVAALRRARAVMAGHLAVGIGLLAWILLEVAGVVVSPPLQIVFGLVGVAIVVLAVNELGRRRSAS